jgi:hypothetical protein
MKLTNGEIFDATEPMKALLEEKLPVQASYALAKLAMKLEEPMKVIEQVRQRLISDYGEKDPENPMTTRVVKGSEGYPEFMRELTILLTQEVEIESEQVELPDTLEIAPKTLIALDKLVRVNGTN